MRFFRAIARFFKNLTATAKPNRTTKPTEIVKEPAPNFIPVFFWVVGHNEYAKGTRNEIDGEYEYDFSMVVGDMFLSSLDNLCSRIPVFKLIRPIGRYGHQVRSIRNQIKKITNKMKSFGLNSHFNDGGGSGNENLIIKGSKENFDDLLADLLSDCLDVCLNIPQRRKDGVYEITEKHNGGGMLAGMADVNCTSSIIEPTWKRDFPESRKIFSNKARYARIIAETVVIIYFIKGYVKKKDILVELKYWNITGDKPIPRRFINE